MKRCPPPSPTYTGRQDILRPMHAFFSTNVGKRHVLALHGLGGAGKSQTAYKFIEESQAQQASV
jgi:putative protein kinase ArgK-like GTPase of G3E family